MVFDPNSVTRTPRDGSAYADLIIDKVNALAPAAQTSAIAFLGTLGLPVPDPQSSANQDNLRVKLAQSPRDMLVVGLVALLTTFDERTGRLEVTLSAADMLAFGADTDPEVIAMGTMPAGAKVVLAYARNNGEEMTGLISLASEIGDAAADDNILSSGATFLIDAVNQISASQFPTTPHAERDVILTLTPGANWSLLTGGSDGLTAVVVFEK